MCSLLGETLAAVNHLQDERLFGSWHFEVILSVVDQCVSLFFLRTHKIGNLFPNICSFPLCLHHMMLVNVKLGISGSMRTVFEGCRFHCFSSFLMPQLKRSCQYLHSCIAERLCKTLLINYQNLMSLQVIRP